MLRRTLLKGILGAATVPFGDRSQGFRNAIAAVFEAGNTIKINKNGLFIYNGTPALGNLIASITPAVGTDQYGNLYGIGINAYTATDTTQFSAVGIAQNHLGHNTGQLIYINNGTPAWYLRAFSPFAQVMADAITAVDPATLPSPNPETLHSFTGANSWAQTAANATWGYRFMPDGEVEITGAVTVPAGFVAGQIMSSAIPLAYRPAHNLRLLAVDTTLNLVVSLALFTNGTLIFEGPVANTAVGNALSIVHAHLNIGA